MTMTRIEAADGPAAISGDEDVPAPERALHQVRYEDGLSLRQAFPGDRIRDGYSLADVQLVITEAYVAQQTMATSWG